MVLQNRRHMWSVPQTRVHGCCQCHMACCQWGSPICRLGAYGSPSPTTTTYGTYFFGQALLTRCVCVRIVLRRICFAPICIGYDCMYLQASISISTNAECTKREPECQSKLHQCGTVAYVMFIMPRDLKAPIYSVPTLCTPRRCSSVRHNASRLRFILCLRIAFHVNGYPRTGNQQRRNTRI